MPSPPPARHWVRSVHVLLAAAAVSGCFRLMSTEGGGQTRFEPPRVVDPGDVALVEGYRIEAVATGLTFPTGIAFDDQGRVHVTESGYSYGEVWLTPRLLRIAEGGGTTVVAEGRNPPWNGVDYHDGAFYVAGGHAEPGQILRVDASGRVTVVVDSLPSLGDHHTNAPVAGPDGWIYFGQGTATNAGVVGVDNHEYGWLQRHPEFHDVPCEDVVLAGRNFTTPNPLTGDPGDRATTGAYMPFGTPSSPGQVVRGRVPCGGAIMRVHPGREELELVAWGLRNPFGLAFAPDGRLYAAENQYDVRGSRPVFGTGDLLWQIEPGRWYGWPDFHGSRPLTENDWFDPPDGDAPRQVLQRHPAIPPDPVVPLGVHSASSGMTFSHNPEFGYVGDAFIAQFGDMAPQVGKTLDPVGFKVVRVDVGGGTIHDFAINRGRDNGPASRLGTGGLERPLDVEFSPDGRALYVADFGVMLMDRERGPMPQPGTGVLWRITRLGGGAP